MRIACTELEQFGVVVHTAREHGAASETACHTARCIDRASRPRTEVAVVVDSVVVAAAGAARNRRRFGNAQIVQVERLEVLDQPVLQRELMAYVDLAERAA